jgi:hypothetical protein
LPGYPYYPFPPQKGECNYQDEKDTKDSLAKRLLQFFKHNPEGIQIKLDSMNLYKLENGKVKEWQIWVNITEL